ncbi:MAG: LuxR C-terminal-related transcriptional regulator [Solirubrobacterales bacterium]
MGEVPRCLVVEPQPLIRLGIRRVLDQHYEIEELTSREEAIDLIRDIGDFDVIVVDIRSRAGGSTDGLGGAEAIRRLRRAEPALGIVAHGDRAERHLAMQALSAGASAYVSRGAGPDDLRSAVEAAAEQERFVDPAVPQPGSRGRLTVRQRQILQLLADGGSTTIAAEELQVSEETVRTHTKNILARLEARNRAHAVAIGLRESLIE